MLVRTVAGQVRGWLSDRFRRIDSRPLLEALSQEAASLGAVPVDGVVTETRLALKILLPEILEPVPGEFVALGGEWSNSDFGNGTHSFRAFALPRRLPERRRRGNALRQVHLGARLHDDIKLSAQTYRLDTTPQRLRAPRRRPRDARPEGARSPPRKIQQAHRTTYSGAQLATATRRLPKATAKTIADAFTGNDVVNLPPGNTAWRASNAISWIARATEDAEARLDLKRLAGAVM